MPLSRSGGRRGGGRLASAGGVGAQDESLARVWLSSGELQEAELPCEASGDLEDAERSTTLLSSLMIGQGAGGVVPWVDDGGPVASLVGPECSGLVLAAAIFLFALEG